MVYFVLIKDIQAGEGVSDSTYALSSISVAEPSIFEIMLHAVSIPLDKALRKTRNRYSVSGYMSKVIVRNQCKSNCFIMKIIILRSIQR